MKTILVFLLIFSVTVPSVPNKILRGVTEEAIRESEDCEVKICLAEVRNIEQCCKSYRQYFSLSKENITEISTLEKYCDSMHQCFEPNTSIDRKDAFGFTALMRAICLNNSRSIDLLLEKKADANQKNEDGVTPLMYVVSQCCKHGKKEQLNFIRMLCKHGADPYIKNEDGESVVDLIRGKNGSYFQKIRKALGLPRR